MNDRMRRALLAMYDMMDDAGMRQEARGGHDQGARANVTSGKHLDLVAEVIAEDLLAAGYHEEDVVWGGKSGTLPGWFRVAKDWDLLAFDGQNLLAAVELKSINSSFGNNANNRAEEAIGSAMDARYAIRNDLVRFQVRPPVLGYVLVIRDCYESRRQCRDRGAQYPVDDVFNSTSYLDRLTIMCRRLLAERIYQAVWVVYVNPDELGVFEPDRELCYEAFIATLASQFYIASAAS